MLHTWVRHRFSLTGAFEVPQYIEYMLHGLTCVPLSSVSHFCLLAAQNSRSMSIATHADEQALN